MTDPRPCQPLVIQTTDPDLRILNPETLNAAGVIIIIPPGVTWQPFVVTAPPTYDDLTDCTDVTCEDCRRRAAARPAEAARNGYDACGNGDGPDGATCTRPPGHDSDHSTYDPSTGFSRYWDTIHVPARPLVHGVKDLTTDGHGRVRSLCSLAMRPDDTYVLIGRSAIYNPADVSCPDCTTISAHGVAP